MLLLAMKISAKETFLLILVVILFSLAGWFVGNNKLFHKNSLSSKVSIIATLLESEYYPIFTQNNSDLVLAGMFTQLDDNSYYLNSDEYTTIKESRSERSAISLERLDEDTFLAAFSWFSEDMDYIQFLDMENTSQTSLILDLRTNTGGDLASAVELLDLFLSDKTLFYEKDRYGEKEIRSSSNTPLSDIQIFVLIGNKTASAAEIVASALQSNDRATIVGIHSSGKTTLGNYFELSDGSAIHLTTGEWLGVKKNSYINGITPDLAYTFITPNLLIESLKEKQ